MRNNLLLFILQTFDEVFTEVGLEIVKKNLSSHPAIEIPTRPSNSSYHSGWQAAQIHFNLQLPWWCLNCQCSVRLFSFHHVLNFQRNVSSKPKREFANKRSGLQNKLPIQVCKNYTCLKLERQCSMHWSNHSV